jgi:hypothetical protein
MNFKNKIFTSLWQNSFKLSVFKMEYFQSQFFSGKNANKLQKNPIAKKLIFTST